MSRLSLPELEQSLRGAVADGALPLTSERLGEGALASFIDLLPERRLPLSDVELTGGSDEGTLQLRGRCTGRWHMPGAGLAVEPHELVVRFTAGEDAVREMVAVHATLPVAAGELALLGTVIEGGLLTFRVTYAEPVPVTLPALLDVAGVELRQGLLPGVIGDLAQLGVVESRVDVVYSSAAPSRLELGCALPLDPVTLGDKLTLQLDQIRVLRSELRHPRYGRRRHAGASLHGVVTIDGNPFDMRMGLLDMEVLELDVLPADGDVLPGLAALGDLAGGEGGGDALRATLEEHHIALSIDAVALRLQARDLAFRSVSLRAHITWEDLEFRVAARLPRFAFHGELGANSEPIRLRALIGRHLGDPSWFPEVDITRLAIDGEPGAGRIRLHVEVLSDFEATLGELTLGVSRLELSIDRSKGVGSTGFGRIVFTLLGSVFEAGVSHEAADGKWLFRARSVGNEPLSLTTLVRDLLDLFGLPSLPSEVPDVQLSRLDLSFGTGDEPFHIHAELAAPGTLPLGANVHDVHGRVDLRVEKDEESGKRAFSGTFEADLMIGDVRFAVGYEMGKETHVFQGAAASDGAIRLPDLAAALGIPIADLAIPDQAGVALTGAAFRYQHEQHTFSLVADTSVGRAFLAAGKPDPEGSWGLVFGVEVEGEGLPALLSPGDELHDAPLATTLRLRELVLTLATQDWTEVQLPALPGTPDQSGTEGQDGTTLFDALSTHTLSFSRGLSAQGILDLTQSTDGDARLKNLQGLLGDPDARLVASCTLSPSKVELEVRLDGGLVLTGASPARPDTPGALALAGAGILVQLRPQMKVEAYGKALIPVYDTTLQATGRAVLTTRDAHCEFSLSTVGDGSSDGMTLPGLPGLHIDEVGVEVGVTFTPPGLELGLEAGFHLGTQERGANQLALLLALEGELPDPLLLYARFDELSADRLMEVVGRDPTTLPAAIRQVRAEDLMIYYAQMDLELPDGREIKPGFGVHGLVVIGGFRAFARLDVSEESGITGLAEVSPLSLAGGAVRLTGNGSGVTRPEVSVDGKSRPAGVPRLQAKNDGGEPETNVMVPPGGAVVAFSTQHEPYLNVSLQLTLLDAIGTDLEVEVKDQELHLLLETRLGDAGHIRFGCDVGPDAFSASADVELDLYGTIGPVRIGDLTIPELVLDLVVAGQLSVQVKDEKLEFEIAGRLAFDGLSVELAPTTITADVQSLEELPQRLLEEIGRDAAHFLPDLVDEAGRAADELGTEIQAFLDELAGHRTYAAGGGVAIRNALPREAEEVFAMAVEDPATLAHQAKAILDQVEELRASAEEQAGAIRATANAQVEAILARAAAVREAGSAEAARIAEAAAGETQLHAERATARRTEAEDCCARHARTGMEQAEHLRQLAAAAARRHREAAASAAAAMAEHAGHLREQAERRPLPAGLGHRGEAPEGPVIVTTPDAGAR